MNLKKLMLPALAILSLAACRKEAEHHMTLSTKEISVPSEGGTVTFTVDANVYYRVNNDCDFAKIIDQATEGDITTFTLRVDENTKFEPREEYIRFIGDYVTPLRLLISQARFVTYGVDPTEINVTAYDTKASFTVMGDAAWTAKSDNASFVLDQTSGVGEAEVNVTFPANKDEVAKTATVTVTNNGKDYTVKITQAALVKEYTDLSAKGTSNCYIVSNQGMYKFKATVRGNGVVPASQTSFVKDIAPASVKVLWSTFNTSTAPATDNEIISEVELKDGYVRFTKGVKDGNVVIAAYDGAGAIIWSWHIWVTTLGSDIQLGTDFWMDRNLGALAPSVKGTSDGLAAGFFYEWGRKDPFRGTYTFQEPSLGECDMATTGSWPASELMAEGKGGIDASIANPQQYWHVADANHNNKDWIWGVQYDDLWGAGAVASAKDLSAFPKTTKSLFDPCPQGYCIPTSKQFNEAGTTAGISKSDIIKQETDPAIYGIGNDTFYLCYAGGIGYNTGTIGGPVGQYSWYATSCTNKVNQFCARSHTTAYNWGGAASGRTCGYSVRCVKE